MADTSSGAVLIGTAVLVTGNSYSVRDTLKQVGEGSWCKGLNGWVFPESKRDEVEAACKKAGAVVEAGNTVKAPPTASIAANATLNVSSHKKAILVTGAVSHPIPSSPVLSHPIGILLPHKAPSVPKSFRPMLLRLIPPLPISWYQETRWQSRRSCPVWGAHGTEG